MVGTYLDTYKIDCADVEGKFKKNWSLFVH